ncbi:cytoplasmic protein [Mycena floridula]|nr:cytoplasmic protein [Mycena floridula]
MSRLLRFLGILSLVSFVTADLSLLAIRDEGHVHHGQPLLELNETELLLHHSPTPPSYYTIDWDNIDATESSHRGLMIMHVLFMSLAFFVVLPAGIAMSFYGLVALGIASSGLYRKFTPNISGSVHAKQGYLILVLAAILTSLQIYHLLQRIASYFQRREKFVFKTFWSKAIVGRNVESGHSSAAEYLGLMTDDVEEPRMPQAKQMDHRANCQDHVEMAEWANDSFEPNKQSFLAKAGTVTYAVIERSLILAGSVQVISGIVIYSGGCRESYLNGCLAHLIKGAIFWCYGLFTFARFLGFGSEYGWAWNRAPNSRYPTAELVECSLIFLYGATNTWMERFGAHPGDPFTAKQIEHIGIAVMFWFVGLLGIALESKTLRRWLASGLGRNGTQELASYKLSCNPFPALVIGVTGSAMSAHTQAYVFQVQIHELWGNFLLASSVMRVLTYLLLWLGPPSSILPSRPPTEALGSFFLALGGLTFMFSTEELTLAAMRRGKDDVMMFLTVAVAMTAIAFCWAIFVVGFTGWVRARRATHLVV